MDCNRCGKKYTTKIFEDFNLCEGCLNKAKLELGHIDISEYYICKYGEK